MYEIVNELARKNDKYNNNIEKISVLETENDRLMAEIYLDIKNAGNDILKEIYQNEEYLKLLPAISPSLDIVIEAISNEEVNNQSIAKLIIEILMEIKVHGNNVKKDESKSTSKNFLDKFVKIVKEDLENDN
ncbi:MAG: hypothetical protein NC489_29375 [Ruminococcus flavefaciens]|nr:hypothetical protein [Ruminococcus flavefaciens]